VPIDGKLSSGKINMGGEKSSLMDGADILTVTGKVCTRQHSVNGPRRLSPLVQVYFQFQLMTDLQSINFSGCE
jgi:hypothetical protein